MTTTREKITPRSCEATIATPNGTIEDYAPAKRERTVCTQDPNQTIVNVAECQMAEVTHAANSIEQKIAARPTGMLAVRRSCLR